MRTIIWAANRHLVERHNSHTYVVGHRSFATAANATAAKATSWAKALGERARRNRMQRLARKRGRK